MSSRVSRYPLAALWVRMNPLNGYADACSVRRVSVLRRPVDGFATVELREGSAVTTRHVDVAELASTEAKAAALVANHFTELLARPLLSPVAGMTAGSADILPTAPKAEKPAALAGMEAAK